MEVYGLFLLLHFMAETEGFREEFRCSCRSWENIFEEFIGVLFVPNFTCLVAHLRLSESKRSGPHVQHCKPLTYDDGSQVRTKRLVTAPVVTARSNIVLETNT